jgi:hypothetical protein
MTEEHKEKIRLAQIRRWAVRKHLAEEAAKPDCRRTGTGDDAGVSRVG